MSKARRNSGNSLSRSGLSHQACELVKGKRQFSSWFRARGRAAAAGSFNQEVVDRGTRKAANPHGASETARIAGDVQS